MMKENCPECKVHRGHKAGCSLEGKPRIFPTDEEFDESLKHPLPVVNPYSLAKYREFLRAKTNLASDFGITIDPAEVWECAARDFIPEPHETAAVIWAARGGRRALYESFGMGKTIQQLEILRLILKHAGGRGLIVAPLGVHQEFQTDARMLGVEITFVQRTEDLAATGIYLTNYQTVRDGKLDPRAFTVASLDEASILRGFGGMKPFQVCLL